LVGFLMFIQGSIGLFVSVAGQGFAAGNCRCLCSLADDRSFFILLPVHVCSRTECVVASFLEQCDSRHSLVCHSRNRGRARGVGLALADGCSSATGRCQPGPKTYPVAGVGRGSLTSSQPRGAAFSLGGQRFIPAADQRSAHALEGFSPQEKRHLVY